MKIQIKTSKEKDWREMALFAIILFTFIILAQMTLSSITNLEINNGDNQVKSEKDLNCYFTISDTTDVNVTWYKNYQHDRNLSLSCTAGVECYTSLGSGQVPSSNITKGDQWTCGIVYWNGTDSLMSNFTVTISDTPPTQPRIYNENGTELFNTTTIIMPEDSVTLLDANSTDIDKSDTIDYELNDTSFCSINSITGLINCAPTLESQIGFRKLQIRAVTDEAITIQTININVTPTNDAPRFVPALSKQNMTNGQFFNYKITSADDENNTPMHLTIINVTRGGVQVDLNLTVLTIDNSSFYIVLGNNRTATYWESFYSYNVTVSLNDSASDSKSNNQTFELYGITTNDLPNISYSIKNENSLIQGGNLEVYINATDMNNDTLTFFSASPLYPLNYTSATYYAAIQGQPSMAYAWINLTFPAVLTNDHVVDHNITIFVYDTNENITKTIPLDIENTNDAPIIHEISNNSENTYGNKNISELIAYSGAPLVYHLNASDPDDLTYDKANTGIKNYSTNDTRFNISSTGIISFIGPTAGNYSIQFNVTDGGGLKDSIVSHIEVLSNSNPHFQDNITLECWEFDPINYNLSCYYNLSDYVNDTDNLTGDDYIANFWTNSTVFIVNSSTGIFNFTPNQTLVGNYTIMLNATDSKGGMNSTNLTLRIYNTNNRPTFFSVNKPLENMIEGIPYQLTFIVSDLDLNLSNSYENLTFNITVNGTNTTVFGFAKADGSATTALLNITPISENYEGNYSINVTVTDAFYNASSYEMTLYIYNATAAPQITQITPFGSPLSNDSVNISWANAGLFDNMTTNITIYENQTYTFNSTAFADNSSYPNNLSYEWLYDGIQVSTAANYSRYFNFYSNGTHNLTMIVTDEYSSSTSFKWNMNVINVNRPPAYTNGTLYNLTITGSGFLDNYMTYKTLPGPTFVPVFYDIDDDEIGNGYTVNNETTLVFGSSPCPYANFTFPDHRLNILAYSVGECYVIFTAMDRDNITMSASSETILINITNVTATIIPDPTPINTQTTGGGSESQPYPIPMPEEVEKPVPLQIVTPKLVTVYKNATIKVPIIINNTWNGTLAGITLEGETNASNVSIYLDKIYIPKLDKGESTEATLYIRNYKSDGHYEIHITANVSVPKYTDTATIFINSAEMRSEGDEAENKISFAQDLLSSNPECQELNELLGQAKVELGNENYEGTARIVDSVINGCKFLVNNAKVNKEMPDRNFIKTLEWKKSYNDYLIIGFFALLFMSSLYYILKKDNPENDF